MNEIYHCKRIWKDRNQNIEKGDVGWVEDKDLPDLVVDWRIILGHIKCYGEHLEHIDIPFFHNKDKKIGIWFINTDAITIIGNLEHFDKVMNEYYNKVKIFKNN